MERIRRLVAVLTFCQRCGRYEFATQHGPFLWRCDECGIIIPRELEGS